MNEQRTYVISRRRTHSIRIGESTGQINEIYDAKLNNKIAGGFFGARGLGNLLASKDVDDGNQPAIFKSDLNTKDFVSLVEGRIVYTQIDLISSEDKTKVIQGYIESYAELNAKKLQEVV